MWSDLHIAGAVISAKQGGPCRCCPHKDVPCAIISGAPNVQVDDIEAVEKGLLQEAQRFFLLTQTDNMWKEHLQVSCL